MLQDLTAAINSIIFSPQWINVPPHSARISWCHLHTTLWSFSLPYCCYMLISWQQGRIYLAPPGNRTRISVVKVRRHKHHTTNCRCVPNFTVDLIPLPQSRTDPGNIPLSSRCTRYFSLRHHDPIFSLIYLLGGQGRHVWQIVRQLPMKAVWWDASLMLWYLVVNNLHNIKYGR